MAYIEGIPSYVLQNMSMIQDNLKSVMADNLRIGGAKEDFDSFLESAIGDMSSTFSDIGFDDGVVYSKNAYDSMPGVSGNTTRLSNQQLMNELQTGKKDLNSPTLPEAKIVDKAYDSILKGDLAKNLSPEISSKLASIAGNENKNLIDKLKNIGSSNNTSLVTDEEFFDAEALTPNQITEILKKKGSPYAYQTFEGGKSIGQLIYDECHKAGSVEKGSNTLNPALIISIMGAESSFGTDKKTHKNNPFNIRINGSFENVKSFEQSLNMAVNTMYNWAVNRPENSKLSYLDYAGDKYCEDYTKDWKPNVEKYFTEFTVLNPSIASKKEEDHKSKLLDQMVSTLGTSNPMLKGMNLETLLKTSNTKNIDQNMLSNINLVSGASPSVELEDSEE
ncbi:MAG: hypothetical protein U0354_06465 [Candidatus Sericytochromatia bacterium]